MTSCSLSANTDLEHLSGNSVTRGSGCLGHVNPPMTLSLSDTRTSDNGVKVQASVTSCLHQPTIAKRGVSMWVISMLFDSHNIG